MNQVITIPRKIVQKGDLVLVPKKEYDTLVRIKEDAEEKRALDAELAIALEEVRQGKTIGPFNNVRDLMKALRTRKSRRNA